MKSYYSKKQNIQQLSKKGKPIGAVEKWEAHKMGKLHKALSVVLIYKNQYILQHRKHPAFDGVFDLTSSSHQLIIKNNLQSSIEATYECLRREWNLDKKDLIGEIKAVGMIYYKAKDPRSIYEEHEMCDMLSVKLKSLPKPNYDFAYGFSLVDKKTLTNKNSLIYKNLAPWSKVAIKKGFI